MKSFIVFLFILFAGLQVAHAQSINVSCTDSIKSLNKTATPEFVVTCPVNCTRGSVWGVDTYTTDSAICVAAVHAGVVSTNGGEAKVKLLPGQGSYAGSSRNGVTTQGWGQYDQSFSVSPNVNVLNISCTDSIKSLNKTATPEFSVNCPVNCTSGSVWGVDTYTTDSAICVAAVHAGVIKTNGGAVKVKLLPGKDSYAGSPRNGVTTQGWGRYDQSFSVSK